MGKKSSIFTDGIIKNNQALVFLIGMCPTLAVTNTLNRAIGMGIAVFAVLLLSNIVISATRKVIPDEIRLPIYIILIATIVSIVSMLLNAYAYSTAESLGVFLSLIVVNCIILGRAEAFAGKNTVIDSILDACGITVGYVLALVIVSTCRELISTADLVLNVPLTDTKIFSLRGILGDSTSVNKFLDTIKISIFSQPVGAFFTLGLIIGIVNHIRIKNAVKAAAAAKKSEGK